MTYLRDRDAAERMVEELTGLGVRSCARRAFFGDPRDDVPAKVMEWVTGELGPPTLLVSNAGTGVPLSLVDTRRSHWDWAVETHARSMLRLVQAGPGLRSVLAVSSIGASRVLPHAYGLLAASKAAQESLVRYLAVELAPRCRVNAVTPGLVDTAAARELPMAQAALRRGAAQNASGAADEPAGRRRAGRVPALRRGRNDHRPDDLVINGGYSILM